MIVQPIIRFLFDRREIGVLGASKSNAMNRFTLHNTYYCNYNSYGSSNTSNRLIP